MKNLLSSILILLVLAAPNFSQTIEKVGFTKSGEKSGDLMIFNENNFIEKTENKISPLLNQALMRIENEYMKTSFISEEVYQSLNQKIVVKKNETGELIFPLFIKTTDINSITAIIENAGGAVHTVAGDILTAEIPYHSVRYVSDQSSVIYTDASFFSEPYLNLSRTEIKADQVHNGTGLPQSYKGSGVIVGVIDSGIDWKHEDFKNVSGNRIQYLWDMSSTGNSPAGYNYGTEYTKAQLDAQQCQQVDGNDGGGHGTHVTGTAAGNAGANANYLGMAPESDIIFVKGFRYGPNFPNADVVNGCNYIFQKAAQMQKPAVINLSLGGHYGPHDGTSLYEQSLSNLTGQGKVIVAAAGNEGNSNRHLGYSTSGSSINEAKETIWVFSQTSTYSVIDMWYNTGSISVGIAFYDQQFNLIGYTNAVAPGQSIENQLMTVSGTTYGKVTIDATTTNDPNNGSKRVVFVIDGNNGQYPVNSVYWSLYTFGNGTFDAWGVTGGYFTTDSNPNAGIIPGDNEKTIGIPSTAMKVMSIGSYVTKTQWVDIDGNTWNQGGNPTIGAKSGFSSMGPSRDGRMKPDLTAPGEVIIAALSSDLTIGPNNTPRQHILQGGKLQKMQGTSMAAPHITGIVALMLQRNPALDYQQVFDILTSTTRKDAFTGGSNSNLYGYGKIDAYEAVKNTPGGGGGTQVSLLKEGFDGTFPPAGWTKTTTISSHTWNQGNPSNNNFNTIDPASLNSAICPWVNQNQNEWLISPAFSLGDGDAYVEFYAGYSTQWLTSATMKMHISTNSGANWTELWSAENDGQPWGWRKKTVNLTPYKNKTGLQLAWQYVGNDGDLVGLDGIEIVGFQYTTDIDDKNKLVPENYSLAQNYPNPFNPATVISYQLPENSFVSLKVYDILGNEVATLINEHKSPGYYEVVFDANKLSSGVYIYRLHAKANNGNSSDYINVKKMVLIR